MRAGRDGLAAGGDVTDNTLGDESERTLGPQHPHTIRARGNLAVSYYEVGWTSEANALHETVLADSEHALGPHHPDTHTIRRNLATLRRLRQQG